VCSIKSVQFSSVQYVCNTPQSVLPEQLGGQVGICVNVGVDTARC